MHDAVQGEWHTVSAHSADNTPTGEQSASPFRYASREASADGSVSSQEAPAVLMTGLSAEAGVPGSQPLQPITEGEVPYWNESTGRWVPPGMLGGSQLPRRISEEHPTTHPSTTHPSGSQRGHHESPGCSFQAANDVQLSFKRVGFAYPFKPLYAMLDMEEGNMAPGDVWRANQAQKSGMSSARSLHADAMTDDAIGSRKKLRCVVFPLLSPPLPSPVAVGLSTGPAPDLLVACAFLHRRHCGIQKQA